MELLGELLSPIDDKSSFLRSKIDMTLLGWVVMYLCLCLDGVNCTLTSSFSPSGSGTAGNGGSKGKEKEVSCVSSRWDFIQGESALYRKVTGSSRLSGNSGFKRRIQKKLMATKQKLEELDTVAAGLGYATQVIITLAANILKYIFFACSENEEMFLYKIATWWFGKQVVGVGKPDRGNKAEAG